MKTKWIAGIAAFLLPIAVLGQSRTFNDWGAAAMDDKSGVFAATTNDSGSAFGLFCNFGQPCDYRVGFTNTCTPGAQYPAMFATDKGSAHITLTCLFKAAGSAMYTYSIEPHDGMDWAVTKGSRLSFAVALDGDNFRVVRFSLRGAAAATAYVRAAFERLESAGAKSKPGGLRDSVL